MKNGDLVVHFQQVCHLDFDNFKTPAEMTHWELGAGNAFPSVYEAYEAKYGEGACDRDGIEELKDIFGEQWADAFFKHKHKLIAQKALPDALLTLESAKRTVISMQYMARTGRQMSESDLNDVMIASESANECTRMREALQWIYNNPCANPSNIHFVAEQALEI